jgi:murein DD-endopeptidase MepM/ murein hydrolase activator NlpD
VLQTTLGNSALVAQLVSILQNPIGAQRPDLLHFQPAARAALALPARSRDLVLTFLLLAIPILWMGGVPLLRLRPRPVAVAAALAPAALAAALVVPAFAARPVAATRLMSRPAASPAVWRQLVAIEARLAGDRRSLQEVESRLERLTAALEAGEPAHGVEPHMFATLAAVHDTDAAAYDHDLQQEYQVYVAAAEQPAVSEELRQGAKAAGMRSAARAIDANLQTVQTQLQQEAVIAQAQAKLQQLGFTPEQAKALQGHDAFVAPVGGPVAQPFGPTDFDREPPLVYHGTFYPHFHTGLDIEAPVGTTVAAAADGVVALVATSTDGQGHTTGYGTYIVVAHAHGYYTLYAHLSAVGVKPGQLVHQGDPIGLVGTTGNSTGPHLHFEIRRDGELLDPLPYVTGRLKPW